MKLNSRSLLIPILALVTILCFVFAACTPSDNPENGKVTYTVNVRSLGGVAISDSNVTILSDGQTIASGKTDSDGKFVFSALPGEYEVQIDNLPKGYSLNTSNAIKTSASQTEVNVEVTSSVIQETVPDNKVYKEGDVIYDFSFTDDKNVTQTLSEVLQTKRMVLLNFWNSHCGPCMNEMPELELAYRKYSDKAEVFGLNVPLLGADTARDIRNLRNTEYTDAEGNTYSISFVLGLDTNQMPLHFAMSAIPVSVVIDRYGVVALHHTGSMDQAGFEEIFEKYTSDDYTQNVGPNNPGNGDGGDDEEERKKPTAVMPDQAEIQQAINKQGFAGTYHAETESDDAEYSWPWLIGQEQDGTQYIYPSNSGENYSFATIYVEFEVTQDAIKNNGQRALVFDLKYACEEWCDYLYVIVNNTLVYEFSDTDHWSEWQTCIPLVAERAGHYTMVLMFNKDQEKAGGADTARIANMRLVSADEIDVPSLDVSRAAAKDWNGNGFESYVTPVLAEDGFYHVNSADGPYLLANLMSQSPFNNRLETDWGISEFANNNYFDYNKVEQDQDGYDATKNKTEAITRYLQAANNSDISGLCVVTEELHSLLDEFVQNQYPTLYNDLSWLEVCMYYEHFGTDESDLGICTPDRNPVRGLINEAAIPLDKIYDGEFDNNKETLVVPDEYKHDVAQTKLIMPRGLRYVITPQVDGVYRFRSQSATDGDTMAWLWTSDNTLLVETEEQLENPDQSYNFVITYYLHAGVSYYLATCYADMGAVGTYTVTVENLGPSAYVWQYASREYFTFDENTMQTLVYKSVTPVLNDSDQTWYNAKRNIDGSLATDRNNDLIPDTSDPIYVDFVTGARFFTEGSLQLALDIGSPANVLKTVAKVLSSMWSTTVTTNMASNKLSSIKGSPLDDKDWTDLLNGLANEYGEENILFIVEDAYATTFAKLVASQTVNEVVTFLINYCVGYFNFRSYILPSVSFATGYYKDYTSLVTKYRDKALANNGDPDRGFQDAGSTPLTEDLRIALMMFSKRMAFEDVEDGWIQFCAHYTYFGPNTAA